MGDYKLLLELTKSLQSYLMYVYILLTIVDRRIYSTPESDHDDNCPNNICPLTIVWQFIRGFLLKIDFCLFEWVHKYKVGQANSIYSP